MEIKAVGGCCSKSLKNYEVIKLAVKELALECEVIHVQKIEEIIELGVLATPGLVVNGRVLSSGTLLTVKKAKKLIQNEIQKN